jgi:hypothetical protein
MDILKIEYLIQNFVDTSINIIPGTFSSLKLNQKKQTS